jgi:hypothetical protein
MTIVVKNLMATRAKALAASGSPAKNLSINYDQMGHVQMDHVLMAKSPKRSVLMG